MNQNMMIESKGGNTTMTGPCRVCKEIITVQVRTEDYLKWKKGAYIQIALHCLDADQREFLISGTCGPCYDKMFGNEEEDDE